MTDAFGAGEATTPAFGPADGLLRWAIGGAGLADVAGAGWLSAPGVGAVLWLADGAAGGFGVAGRSDLTSHHAATISADTTAPRTSPYRFMARP